MKLVILCAMQAEADAILSVIPMLEAHSVLDPKLPFRCFGTELGGHKVSLISSGEDTRFNVDWIGMEAASLMAYCAIRDIKADVLLSAGTAGGFVRRGAQIGTVYLSDRQFYCHDHHVPLSGFEHSAQGHFAAHDVRAIAEQLGLPYGPMSSGSSLSNTERDLAQLAQWQIVAKEMEVAGIGLVAHMTQTPLFALKAITNLIDDESSSSAQQFDKNFALACAELTREIVRVVPAYLALRT